MNEALEHRLENLLKSVNVLKLYETAILLHCQHLRLTDERTLEIIKSFKMTIWRRRQKDPATFNKLIDSLWREIVSEALQTEIARRLPSASEDEAFFLKKVLPLKLL